MTNRCGLILLAAMLASCGLALNLGAAERLPNFVIIFIDDMGYADIGRFGAKGYRTPNLDRMAQEGRVFTDFYVSQAVCSASRASMMTGCYNVRVGILGALNHRANYGISAGEMTLAQVVKQKGYATACYGKWHLGHHPKFLPTNHGFDEYLGLPYSNDMWPFHPTAGKDYPDLPLIEGTHVVDASVTPKDQEQLTTLYTERAVRFIEKNKDRPFLVYLPHSMVHVPLYVSDKFRGKTERGLFGDVVMEVDWSVGQILGTLRKHGLEKDTMVIFTSDNGAASGSSAPWRGKKGSIFEGGVREPCIMRWPGRIPAGTTCPHIAGNIDLLPTFARLVGTRLPKDREIDGRDITSLMFQADAPPVRDTHLYFTGGGNLGAIRQGDWKLFLSAPTKARGKKDKAARGGKKDDASDKLVLFNLDKDPAESTDVAADHPDIVAKLVAEAQRREKEIRDHRRPAGEVPKSST